MSETNLFVMDQFTEAFHDGVDARVYGLRALVESLDCGAIYLMGGMVYRSIIADMYGVKRPDVDFDFLVERIPSTISLPGWTVVKNRYGHPKLSNCGVYVDIAPFCTMSSIVRRKVPPTVEQYLAGTPLTLQSLLYSFDDDRVIGETGKESILQKTVAVNDKEEAAFSAAKKGLSLHDFIKQKAESTGFTPIYD
jgi:hypothetical protein